jgi:hypothetical protein
MTPDSTEETTTKPRLLSTRRDRPSLSQSLRPAKPPEEREREADRERETLKGTVHNRER